MRKTLIAIIDLVIAAVIAAAIIAVPWALLGGDEKALWLIVLVFFGTAALELTDIAGTVKTIRYQMAEHRIATRSKSGLTARWNTFWWASGEYRDAFLEKLPRFWFRIAAWALLAAAGILLTNISSTCVMDMKGTEQPDAARPSAMAIPVPGRLASDRGSVKKTTTAAAITTVVQMPAFSGEGYRSSFSQSGLSLLNPTHEELPSVPTESLSLGSTAGVRWSRTASGLRSVATDHEDSETLDHTGYHSMRAYRSL